MLTLSDERFFSLHICKLGNTFWKALYKWDKDSSGGYFTMVASGMTYAQVLEDYPALKREHILAALSFAANRDAIIKIMAT